MPISVECPKCGAKNRFSDQLNGKVGRCKSCGARVQIEKTHVGQGEGPDFKPLLIGAAGGFLGFFLLAGAYSLIDGQIQGGNSGQLAQSGGESAVGTSEGDAAPVASAAAGPSGSSAPPVPRSSGTPAASSTRTVGGNPDPAVAATDNTPPAPPVGAAGGGGFQQPDAGAATANSGFQTDNATDLFQHSVKWSMQPDPGVLKEGPESGNRLRIPIVERRVSKQTVLFPEAPSKYLAVRVGGFSDARYDIYDATTGRKIGDCPANNLSSSAALSPDGKYMAIQANRGGNSGIMVYDIRAKKSLGVLPLTSCDPSRKSVNVSKMAIWEDRLVILSDVGKEFRVWELPSGELLHTISGGDKFSSSQGHCFSPGGQYLAVVGEFLEKRIDFYDLESGKQAGAISVAEKSRVSSLAALGFSWDGSQFSAIYEGNDGIGFRQNKHSRMVVWNLQDSSVAHDLTITPSLSDQLTPVYQAYTLESLPGGRYWLAQSDGIIDVDTGKLIYNLPSSKDGKVDLVPSRKVMGENWLVSVNGAGDNFLIEQLVFSPEELQARAKSVEAGGLPSDAELPPLTPVDPSLAPGAVSSAGWNAKNDPITVADLTVNTSLSASGMVRDLAVSGGENPVLVVRVGINEDRSTAQTPRDDDRIGLPGSSDGHWNRYEPVAEQTELLLFSGDGTSQGKVTIPYSVRLRSISPDGQWGLVEEHRTQGRLDVYALKDGGEHRVGWRPFRDVADKDKREIRQAHFVGNEHVATLSTGDMLVVWNLKSMEPVWRMEKALTYQVTPGGRQLLVAEGTLRTAEKLSVIETATGDGLGAVEMKGYVHALACHPTGQMTAVSIKTAENFFIYTVQMDSGEIIDRIPVPTGVNSLHWVNRDHLLLNGRILLSRPQQAVVWQYSNERTLLPEYLTGEKLPVVTTGGSKTLKAITLPRGDEVGKFSTVSQEQQTTAKPGDSVSLKVQIGSEPELREIRAEIEAALEEKLTSAGYRVSKSAPMTLNVFVSLKNLGPQTLSRIGDRSVQVQVQSKSIEIEYRLEKSAKALWQSKRSHGNIGFMVHVRGEDTAQQSCDQQMTASALAFVRFNPVPAYAFRDDTITKLGRSALLQ